MLPRKVVLDRMLEEALSKSTACDCDSRVFCEQLAGHLHGEAMDDVKARSFDIRRLCDPWLDGMPDASWPTPALLTVARNGILTPPWIEGLRRSVAVTQALALLGERGLPADAYVRLYLSRTLSRRVLVQAVGAYVHARDSRRDRASYPYQVADWFEKFDQLHGAQASLPVLTTEALSGDLMGLAESWIRHAAMAHVIDWRTVDYLAVQIDPRDRVLRGGQEATAWVFDRFSHTSSTEWRRGSAEWEVAFARDPEAVAGFVGVARSVLDDRPTSLEMALAAQVKRLLSQGESDEAARGLHLSQMVEQILAAIRGGHLQHAEDDARSAHSLAPHEFATTNALAFCLIPTNAAHAVNILTELRSRSDDEEQLRLVNLVSAHVSLGDWGSASQTLTRVNPDGHEAYLWAVQSIVDRRPMVEFIHLGDWVNRATRLVKARTKS